MAPAAFQAPAHLRPSRRLQTAERCPLPTGARIARRPKPRAVWRACASEETLSFEALFLKGPVPGDRMLRTISQTGEVSCRVAACTGLVSGAARLHRTSPVASTAFGRALTCSLLLAAGKKDGETLQLEFRGSGPLKGITAIANGAGQVRGYVGNPQASVPLRAGKVDVSAAIGKGILAVVRNSPFSKQPYTGMVQISSGEVAEDVATYLADSEQTPSALGAGVFLGSDGAVTAAAGYLVQLLPGASEETIRLVERNVRALGSPTDLVRAGTAPEDIVDRLMCDLSPMKVASVSPRYYCQCGVDRVKRTVTLIPEDEVRDILREHGKIEGMVYVDSSMARESFTPFLPGFLNSLSWREHDIDSSLPCLFLSNAHHFDAPTSTQLLASFAVRYTRCYRKKLNSCYSPKNRKSPSCEVHRGILSHQRVVLSLSRPS